MNSQNVNFKGIYRSHTANGEKILYKKDDVVIYKGTSYIATRNITETSPIHGTNGGWLAYSGGRTPVQFYWGDKQPTQVNIGDEWFNFSTGKTYKYLSDGNSEQWVNIY